MESKPFKVIIAGGSVAGLSLALMLERNGIDFVILEGYSSIAPQVGASIGMLPNGLRILDQLGCYDDVIERADVNVSNLFFRDSRGQPFWSFEGFGAQMKEQHGYPIVFLERRILIQTLYDHIQDKSKVLTSEKVVTVKNSPSHVTVTTSTGKSFTGDMVAGADGINSTVRQKMWEESQSIDPTWIDPSEVESVPATYSCLFGISDAVPGIERRSLNVVFNDKFSYLVGSGPNRSYWMLFKNMGKTHYGSDIPGLTKEDEEAVAKEHWNDYVSPTVQFSDLYKCRNKSVYTTLVEYVFKKWHFQRIMTIGDACHKLEPLTGQGGNSALETSAALANHLIAALNKSPSRSLSTEHISSIFEKVQNQRQNRVTDLVKTAHTSQRVVSHDTPAMKFAVRYIIPYIPTSLVVSSWVDAYCTAVSLNMLPPSNRPRKVLYHDERPEILKSSGPTGLAMYTGSISIGSISIGSIALLFSLLLFAVPHLFTVASLVQIQTFLI